jgi:hypothetical protein
LNSYNLYQPAIADGPGGITDYSKWYFKYTPTPAAYYAITPGSNTLIAKLTCNGNPSLVKYATIGITGIVAGSPPVVIVSSSANTAHTSFDPVPSISYNTHSSTKIHKVHESSSSTSDVAPKVKVHKVRDSSSSSSDVSDGWTSNVKVHDSKDNNNKDSNGLANNIIKDVKKSVKNMGINIDLE